MDIPLSFCQNYSAWLNFACNNQILWWDIIANTPQKNNWLLQLNVLVWNPMVNNNNKNPMVDNEDKDQ